MRLSDFILLSEEEKKGTILHEGVLIAKRDNQNCKLFLFQLNNYYVEMVCNWQSKSVEEFRAFESTSLLHPYIDSIPLNSLLE